MATTLVDEARRILNVGQIYPSEIEVVSCDAKDASRTDDDVCVIRERAPGETIDAEGKTREVLVDDLFSLSNLRNLGRGAPRGNDFKNYYFRLDPNLALIRPGNVTEAGFTDDGIFYRAPGSLDWQRLDYGQIQAAPAVKTALLPILRRTVQGRKDYDRLNAQLHREGDDRLDYDYARMKSVLWLVNLAPKNDPETSRALLQAFPSLNAEAARLAFFRLESDSDDTRAQLVPTLTGFLSKTAMRESAIGMLGDLGPIAKSAAPDLVRIRETGSPQERNLAKEALSKISPSIPADDWSSEIAAKPLLALENFGSVYIPWYGRAPAGLPWSNEKEQVGSYTSFAAGAAACIGPRYECDQKEGFRIGGMAEVGRMLDGFGYWSFGGKIFLGNENWTGFAEGAAAWYPTGGFTAVRMVEPLIGAGVRWIPFPKYIFAILAGARVDPTELKNGGLRLGLGGGL